MTSIAVPLCVGTCPPEYRIGMAKRNITPVGLINQGGYGLSDGSIVPDAVIGRRGVDQAKGEHISARAMVGALGGTQPGRSACSFTSPRNPGYLIAPVSYVPVIAAEVPVNDNIIFNVPPTIGDHAMCADINLARQIGFLGTSPPTCAAYNQADSNGDPLGNIPVGGPVIP